MKYLSITLNALVVSSGAAASLRGEKRDLAVLYYPRYTGNYETGWCTSNNSFAQGSPGYSTELACCNAQFSSQTSGKCYSMLPSPPTASPVGVNGPDAFYADRTKDYADGVCINTTPAPIGAVIYETELECCKAEYGVQTSGACLGALPSPPTASPLPAAGPDIFYKKPDIDWGIGYCINDHPAPNGAITYESELECCKGAYAGQSSGACLAKLPSPPTASPFGVNGPDAFYADRTKDYAVGVCINTVPAPIGAKIYETELECCKGEYAVQTSGACLGALPSPPTASPLTAAGPDIWYKKPDIDWAKGYCINDHPAPNGATTYESELDCCKGAYAGQSSGACLAELPSPPTASPFGVNGPDAFYADRTKDYADGVCINTLPVPNGAKIYETELECCKGEYAVQTSGACLGALPSPPTASPIPAAGLDIWYKKPDIDWAKGYCINDHPAPNGATTYESELDCCKGAYAGQSTGACLAKLPSPPTASPVGVNENFYKAPNVDWAKGHCINTLPVPGGAKVYESELECCKKEYATQSSGACLASLPSPPTASPAGSDSPFYPLWPSWDAGHCDNDPAERPAGNTYAYASQAECCEAWFPNQSSNACMNFDPTYGSRSPTQAPVL